MSLEDAGEENIQLVNELKDMGKTKIPVEKRSFLKSAGLYPIKNLDKIPTPEPSPESTPEPAVFDISKPTKERAKKSQPKLHGDFLIQLHTMKKIFMLEYLINILSTKIHFY